MKIQQWKDLPATFRETQEEKLATKNNKNWSYLVNVAIETVFMAFVKKFDELFPLTREHVFDGFWQDKTFSMLFENGSKVLHVHMISKTMFYFLFVEIFPPGAVLVHDDWSTNMKIRTSVNLSPQQWRAAKDAAIQNFLLHFISGVDPDGGFVFDEHVLHFLCDVASTETVASCLNFEKTVDYIMEKAGYEVKMIIRWTDGTSKQYKNVGNVGMEKFLCVKHGIRILHCFFPTCWGKGKIDLLGGIVHRLYALMVALLLEKARDLEIVVEVLNEQYATPGETRAESSLSTRAFFYVSKIMNEEAKKKRTTWKTLKFPTGVSNQNYFSPIISIFFFFGFVLRCVSNIV